jgi:PAS domain S-box-containing protein
MRLRTKTSLLMAVIVAASVAAVGILFLSFLEQSLRESIYTGIDSVARTASDSVSQFLDDSLRDTQAIASRFSTETLQERDAETAEKDLRSMFEIYPKFQNGMFLLDEHGDLWADYPPHPETRGKSFAFRQYFTRTMAEGKGIIGTPYRSARTGQPVVTFTSPLRDGSGKLMGLLACSVQLLSPNALGGIRKERIGETGYLYIFDTSRLMIMHPHEERVLERDVPPGANRLFDAALKGFEGIGETVNSRGVHMLVSMKRIPGTHWIIGAQQPSTEAFAPLKEAKRRTVVGILIAAMLAAVVGIVMVRRITDPISKLRRAASDFGEPDFETRLAGMPSTGELGELTETLKHMSRKLSRTMSSLKAATRDWERTFDTVPDAVFLIDQNYGVFRLNLAASRLVDLPFTQAIGRKCYELIHDLDHAPAHCLHKETLASGRIARAEFDEMIPGRVIEITSSPLAEDTGDIVGAVLVARDITAQKEADRAIRESEERYRDIVENSLDAIFTCDRHGRYISCNQAMCEILGYGHNEIIGMSLGDMTDPDTARALGVDFDRVYDTEIPLRDVSYEIVSKGGRRIILRGNVRLTSKAGMKMGLHGIMRDVTEQQVLEAHLQRTEKLEAIGTLAGGIAHDFNNILTAIMGHLNLARLYTEQKDRLTKTLSEAEKAVLRAAGLTRQILTFSKGGEPVKEVVAIPPLVHEAANIALGRASRCTYETFYEENLSAVEADRGQLIQVLTNLLINARQAMPDGGLIQVRAGKRSVRATDRVGTLPEGDYVYVVVRDQGVGIPSRSLHRIFDPFYTTKQEGSGLGLATCHSILTRHGGHIEAASKPGEGTAFTFYLPAKDSVPERLEERGERFEKGEGRILVMDDEESILVVAAQALKKAGYEVDTARDGAGAVALFRIAMEKQRPYHAVILDLTIPGGMGGLDTIKALKTMDSTVRGIVSSGYSHDPVMSNPMHYGFSGAMQKPYKLTDLTRTLSELLRDDGERQAAGGRQKARAAV